MYVFVLFSLGLANSCTFQQGDACSLPTDLGKFDLVLMANLICRLPTPQGVYDLQTLD